MSSEGITSVRLRSEDTWVLTRVSALKLATGPEARTDIERSKLTSATATNGTIEQIRTAARKHDDRLCITDPNRSTGY
jgi:hypothetical protein